MKAAHGSNKKGSVFYNRSFLICFGFTESFRRHFFVCLQNPALQLIACLRIDRMGYVLISPVLSLSARHCNKQTVIALDFLTPGRDYVLTLLTDDPADGSVPRGYRRETRTVRKGDVLTVKMFASGGFCGTLVRTSKGRL